MTTKEIIHRTYSALTVGLLTGYIMSSSMQTLYRSSRFSYIELGCNMILAMGICWITTRQNRPAHYKYYAGIMASLTFLYVYISRISPGDFIYDWDLYRYICRSLGWMALSSYWICIVISTYLSNTKYYNIIPNQSKGVSWLFRGLSWIGQIIVWGFALLFTCEIIRPYNQGF